MSSTFKAFVVLDDKQNNNPNVTSMHGELSPTARSYSTDVGHYASPTDKNLTLAVFSYREQATQARSARAVADLQTQRVVTPEATLNLAFKLTEWVTTSSRDGTINQNEDAFRILLQTTFTGEITVVTTGLHVTDNNVIIPEYIKVISVADDTLLHIWFVDRAFREQYDEYEMVIISPLDDINQFMEEKSVIEPLLQAVNNQTTFSKLIQSTNGIPFTVPESYDTEWVERVNTTNKLITNWTVAIYGIAGQNPEVIKNEIAKHIVDNSSYTDVEWAPIFPELFNPSEFVIVPSWGSIAIEGGVSTDINKPTLNVFTALGQMAEVCPEYPEEHIQKYLNSSVAIFKSTSFIVVGAPNNPDKIFDYENKYPDYIVVPNTDKDFARMTQNTQKWVGVLHTMLKNADIATSSAGLPPGFYLIRRNGFEFVSHRLNGVNYLMVTRKSWVEHFGK